MGARAHPGGRDNLVMNDLTFCLGFRAWNADHLRRCLESLDRFGCPIIVTIGDRDLPEWCDRRGSIMGTRATWVHRPMDGWSRSVALNHAIRTAGTPWVVCTDADMIFPSSFPSACRASLGARSVALTDSRDMNAHATGALVWPLWNGRIPSDDWLTKLSDPHPRLGMGAGMVIPRAWCLDIGGFDETYTGWGCDDTDLVLRARWDGLAVVWLPDTFVVHQWHPREAPPDLWAQVVKNRAYLAEREREGGPVRRNVA